MEFNTLQAYKPQVPNIANIDISKAGKLKDLSVDVMDFILTKPKTSSQEVTSHLIKKIFGKGIREYPHCLSGLNEET